jgi:hypothetical protein
VDAAPAVFTLGRVVPNPTTGTMHLRYGIPRESEVSLAVLDLQGREVSVLARGDAAPGWYDVAWSGVTATGRAPSGLYFVRLQSGGRTLVQRFVLTR